MSDDLISRKALLERINYYFQHTSKEHPEHYAYGVALKEINEALTAFDKKKVIERLYDFGELIPSFVLENLVRIIEKGGVE